MHESVVVPIEDQERFMSFATFDYAFWQHMHDTIIYLGGYLTKARQKIIHNTTASKYDHSRPSEPCSHFFLYLPLDASRNLPHRNPDPPDISAAWIWVFWRANHDKASPNPTS